MTVVSNVEQYLWYEVVSTFEMIMDFVRGKKNGKMTFSCQFEKLKKAIHFFMLDLDVEDFKDLKLLKDLKLPSEQKSEDKESQTGDSPKAKTGVAEAGKQLQLFFVKTSKNVLLGIVLAVEYLVESLSDKLLRDEVDYENKRKE
ncbi:hypothetical protein OAD66_07680 [Bacteroidia bacterium]|nr:hypothetical protein [Bacteroidia bacterium]